MGDAWLLNHSLLMPMSGGSLLVVVGKQLPSQIGGV